MSNKLTWAIIEDIFDSCLCDIAILESNDVEPATTFFTIIKLEDKIIEEYVPACDII